MKTKKGLLFVFLGAVLFSLGGLFIKLIPWHPLSINGFRCIFSSSILFLFIKVTKRPVKRTKGVLLSGAAVCATIVLLTMATKNTTAANAILLQYVAPIFVILFSWLFFKERPKGLDILACLLVFGGIACFFLDSLGSGRMAGNLMAIGSGICYAWVFLGNKLPGGDPVCAAMAGQAMGILVGLPTLVRETQFDPRTLTLAVLLGVFQLGLAYVFFSVGLTLVTPIAASLVAGVEPILNPLLVAFFLGEKLTGLSMVGGAMVFVTVMGYNILSARRENQIENM